ncbi:MAG: glycosyltransferase [Rhabdochlamydiaceae bacterium]|jgi:hypothetical protein
MKSYRWLILLLLPFLLGCSKKEEKADKNDFETLMGHGLPAWKYVQTPEDFENLQFFKTVYEKNIPFLQMKSSMYHVPKVIHFIWIGPKPFPRESVENVRSWIAKHPDWTIKFWTDRERPLPHKQMELARVQDLKFTKLFDCYKKSDNYAEKSDLLRYEILYQEGGIYVDHDVKCFQSFDPFCKAYDFYCGLEMPHESPLSSSVIPTNNLIGSRQGHPILKRCMEWLDVEWDRIEHEYPGKDRDAIINRVAHRTFQVVGRTFMSLANKEGNRDIALPTFYFNAPEEKDALFARHLYKGTWFENETEFEKNVRERLVKISKKTNKILLAFGAFSFINIIGLVILFMKYRRTSAKI